MKTRFLPVLCLCALLLGSNSVTTSAQDKGAKAADPYAFSTRVYRLPSDELAIGFVSKERGKLRASPLPGLNASNGEIEAFIKRSHDVVKEYLAQQSVSLPKGSLACYDPETGTLALRAMAVVHDVVQPFAEMMRNHKPNLTAWSLDILEAPSTAARTALKEATGQADHSEVYDHLLPQSKIVVTMRGETRSGCRTMAKQGTQSSDPIVYRLDEKNRIESDLDSRQAGTELELEPTIGADGNLIDLNLSLRHQHSAGTPRWDTLTAATTERIQARWMVRPLASLKTSLTLKSGYTKMLGLFALDGATEPARADQVRVAFLRAAIVKVEPLENPRVEQMLKSRGESVDPTPKAVRPVADPNLPPGMIVRRFRVPPDFLSMGGGPSAADPFAAAAPANEPRFTRQVTVEELLRSQGIPFPDGASANFLANTAELVVRNTPANIDLVAEFVASIIDQKPKSPFIQIQIVQADAALIRRLDRSTFNLPDHVAAWKELEVAVAKGSAKIVRSAMIETKSGQQCTTESVVEYEHTEAFGSVRDSATDQPKHPADNDAAKPAPANVTVTNNTAGRLLEVTGDAKPVGLRMELEPTVGADNQTVDLNLSVEFDYAPPVQRLLDEPPPEKTVQLAAPVTEFHKHEFRTSTTMRSGSTRLISVWKPAGTPELDGDVLQAAFIRVDIVPVEPPKQ